VKNFRYVEKTSTECNEDSYLAILHLSRVELHCKLQEKLHRVTWPLERENFDLERTIVTELYQDFGHLHSMEISRVNFIQRCTRIAWPYVRFLPKGL
jgi:hypothetical protein